MCLNILNTACIFVLFLFFRNHPKDYYLYHKPYVEITISYLSNKVGSFMTLTFIVAVVIFLIIKDVFNFPPSLIFLHELKVVQGKGIDAF